MFTTITSNLAMQILMRATMVFAESDVRAWVVIDLASLSQHDTAIVMATDLTYICRCIFEPLYEPSSLPQDLHHKFGVDES
jgi:hypothetical protein